MTDSFGAMAHRYGASATLEERVACLTEQLAGLEQGESWKRTLQDEVDKPEHSLNDLQGEYALLYSLADKLGIVAAIKRAIIDLHCAANRAEAAATHRQAFRRDERGRSPLPELQSGPRVDGLDAVLAARRDWENVTRDEILKLAAELKQLLVARAIEPSGADASDSGKKLKPSDTDSPVEALEDAIAPPKRQKLSVSRFLYDGNDLLRALQAIRPANRAVGTTAGATWGSIMLQLYTPSLAECRRAFVELAPGVGHIGLDDLFPTERAQFIAEKNRVGDLVLMHHSMSMARQYAKTGCPTSIRVKMWRQSMAIDVTAADRSFFQTQLDQADRWSYVTDDMYLLDLQRAIDSCDYFVFEDHLKSSMLAFSRDPHVKENAMAVNGAVSCTWISPEGDNSTAPPNDSIPPNGVLPFSGLIMYLAPLTYISTDTAEIYFVFREMYVRYWSRLNAISPEPSTILHLCKLFEALVSQSAPTVCYHLVNAGIQPLDIAFPWIQSAFSGVLDIPQVLLLWDRVVGFDSLDVLAHLAAALFQFRSDELLLVSTRDAIDDLFGELMEIQVVPLLQGHLFGPNGF